MKTHGRKYRLRSENNELTRLLFRSDGHSTMKLLCTLLRGSQPIMNSHEMPHFMVVILPLAEQKDKISITDARFCTELFRRLNTNLYVSVTCAV